MKLLLVFLFAFINYSAFADTLFNTTIQNGCANVHDNIIRFETVFTPNTYNCSSGTFLPANGISCAQCPDGWTCAGGEYTFNENIAQGIVYNNIVDTDIDNTCSTNIRFFEPVWAIAEYNCPPGYYLPAGDDWLTDSQGCTQCPNDNYCVGGTYTFNETVSQGIEHCENGYNATVGQSECSPNVITIVWGNAASADISANNAGTTTYGGDIRTPRVAEHIPGKSFVGWHFSKPTNN